MNSRRYDGIDLLEIRPAGATVESTLYLTNAGEEITFGGNDYLAFNFTRSELRESLSSRGGPQGHPTIRITASNIDGQMASLLGTVELYGSRCRLLMHDRRLLLKYPTRTRDALVLMDGEIRDPVLAERHLVFDIVGIMTILEDISVPRRIFEGRCGKTFGSPSCGLDITVSPYTIDATVLSGTTRQFVRVSDTVLSEAGDPDNPTEFWANGTLVMLDGTAAAQGRPIQRVVVGGGQRRFYVKSEFLIAPAPGDTVRILRGCGHTKADCDERGNLEQYGGFEETPHGDLPVIKPVRGNPD